MTTALFSGTEPLLLFLAKATLVLMLAIGATFLLRRSTAGERHLVWLAALVGVLALPLLSRIPALQLGILPSRLAPASASIDAAPHVIIMNAPERTIVSVDTTRPYAIAGARAITVAAPASAASAPASAAA